MQLLDTSEQKVAQDDHVPGGVYYPTSLWKTGEALRDVHFLKVADSAPSDRYRILVGFVSLSLAATSGNADHYR